MSVWFVKPTEKKIDLVYVAADGSQNPFWIKVRQYLTVGEQRRVLTAGWRGMRGGNEIQIDWRAQTFARTEAYLTAWSLNEGNPALDPSRETIESLDADVYTVIEAAITTHIEAAAEEKKASAGTTSPSAT